MNILQSNSDGFETWPEDERLTGDQSSRLRPSGVFICDVLWDVLWR